jgi:hypothetical protein
MDILETIRNSSASSTSAVTDTYQSSYQSSSIRGSKNDYSADLDIPPFLRRNKD